MAMFKNTNNDYDIDLPVIEGGYGAEVNGNVDACVESFDDQLAVIEAMHALDMAEIRLGSKIQAMREANEDPEEIEEAEKELEEVTEGALKNIWEKIKAAFKKLWAKIREFFASVVRFFDGLFMSGKDFVTKYKSQLNKVQKVEVEMFEYTTDIDSNDPADIESAIKGFGAGKDLLDSLRSSATEDTADTLKDMIGMLDDAKEEYLDKVRGEMCGASKITSEDFADELFKHFRNGKDYKETKDFNVAAMVAWLQNNKTLSDIKKAQSTSDKSFSNLIKTIESAERAANKADDKVSQVYANGCSKLTTLVSSIQSIFNTYLNAWKRAVNEQTGAYKSACVKALSKKNKDNQ